MNSNWYKEFFKIDAALDIWQKYVTLDMTSAEADFLESEFQTSPSGQILDVPCGNGRHSVELARRGFQLTGVDIAEENMNRARANANAWKVGAQNINVEFLQADMRELSLGKQFDGAFCFGNSFGYLDYEGMQSFVASVANALKTKGKFCIETYMAAESILPDLADRAWFSIDDMYLLTENSYDVATSRLDTTNTMLYSDGRKEIGESSHLVLTVAEIKRLLTAAGLRTLATYGSLDKEPFEVKQSRLLLVAEKDH